MCSGGVEGGRRTGIWALLCMGLVLEVSSLSVGERKEFF